MNVIQKAIIEDLKDFLNDYIKSCSFYAIRYSSLDFGIGCEHGDISFRFEVHKNLIFGMNNKVAALLDVKLADPKYREKVRAYIGEMLSAEK